MKRMLMLVICVTALSVIGFIVLDDTSIEQIVDVLQTPNGELLILQKEATDQMGESLINYFRPSYQLLLTDTKGNLIRNIPLPKDKPSTFSEYGNLVTDSQNNLYIHRTQKNSDTYYVFYEEILKISSDGKNLTPIYSIDYSKEGNVEYSLITKAYVMGRNMFIIQKSSLDENLRQVVQINLFNLNTGVIQKIQSAPELYVNDLLYMPDKSVVLATLKGELYRYAGGKAERLQYPQMALRYAPLELTPYTENSFAFYDTQLNQLVEIDIANAKMNVLRNAGNVIDNNYQLDYGHLNMISINGVDSFVGSFRVNLEGQRFVFVDQNAQVQVITAYQSNLSQKMISFGKIYLVVLAVGLLVWMAFYLYERSPGSLTVKFAAFLLPMIILIPIISLSVSFTYFNSLAKNDLFAELYHITNERAKVFTPEMIKSFDGLEDYDNTQYETIDVQRLISADAFNNLAHETYNRWYYSVVYRFVEGKLHVIAGDAANYWSTTDFVYGEKGNQIYVNAAKDGKIHLGENSDISGEWVFSLAPIFDENGSVIGLFEVGTGKQSYSYFIQSYYGKLATLNVTVIGIVLLLVMVIIVRIVQPLRRLNVSVTDITAGNWGTTVEVRTHDEIGSLSAGFNKMSLFIKDYINELTKLNSIYYKFIPQKLFDLMEKHSIIEVDLGDYSRQEMTIAYINTFNYFDLTKGMGSKEQLDLLNRIFTEYANAIHTHGGLVGEFRNAGLLALFTEQQDALNAAYSITQSLKESKQDIITTITIHYGEAILGVVGDEGRMSTAVISNCVNEAVALDKYAGKYKCAVLLTDSFINSGFDIKTNARFIGEIMDEHQTASLRISEWLETVPVAKQADFMKTKQQFEVALEAFLAGSYETAKKQFIRVIKDNPHDLVSREYLYKCEKAITEPALFDKHLGRF